MIYVNHVRLILAPDVWERLRPLLLDRDHFATGALRWRSGGCDCREALADEVVIVDRPPRGVDRAPLEDFFVIATRHENHLTASELLVRIAPRAPQMVVVLVFDAHRRQRWDGIVFADGTTSALDGFQVAGSGMLDVQREEADSETDDELDFTLHDLAFSRLRGAVDETVYRKFRRAVVTQIGVSRNGTLAAQQFAALGVALLRLADPQRVGRCNAFGERPGVSRPVDASRNHRRLRLD